jgi:hypothetical protein
MILKICEVCGKMEEIIEEKHDIYGVCDKCMNDFHVDISESI